MQEPPVRRIHEWRDPNRAMRIFENIRILFFTLATVVTFLLIAIWVTVGVTNLFAPVYLIGIAFMRITTPPMQIYMNPPEFFRDHNYCDVFSLFHTFIAWCFVGYGVDLWIVSTARFSKTFTPDTWWWIFVFCTSTIDMTIYICLLCYVRGLRLKDDERNPPVQPPIEMAPVQPRMRQPAIILQLPVIEVVVEKPVAGKHQFYDTCVICLDKFKSGDDVHELGCKHIFHPACIEEWFKKSTVCPTCKERD